METLILLKDFVASFAPIIAGVLLAAILIVASAKEIDGRNDKQ